MKPLLALCLLAAASLSAAEPVSLFDGRSLAGWVPAAAKTPGPGWKILALPRGGEDAGRRA